MTYNRDGESNLAASGSIKQVLVGIDKRDQEQKLQSNKNNNTNNNNSDNTNRGNNNNINNGNKRYPNHIVNPK